MKKILITTFALALLSATSCKDTDFDQDVADITVSRGDANFSKYIALGNSLTSGYRDGALYLDGQNESFPNMIAAQMKLAGGGEFKQPLMPNNVGGFTNLPGFGGKYTLQVVNGALSPVQSAPSAALDNISSGGPYQNLGVPGAKSFHLLASGYGNPAGLSQGLANPYFVRFASSATTSVVADAAAQNATFFSLWIGANDVLSYATNGGMNASTSGGTTTYTPAVFQNGNTNPATYKSNDISDPNVVAGSIKAVLDALKNTGTTKGVIANIPDVTTIPFFTRIPYNTVPLDEAKATAINTSLLTPLRNALTYLGAPNRLNLVSAGNNPVIIIDNSLPNLSAQLTAVLAAGGATPQQAAFLGAAFGQARHAKPGDLILLSASGQLGMDGLTNAPPTQTSQFIIGASYPLHDRFSLTSTEAKNVSTAVAAYNAGIKNLAGSYGLAHVDANSKMAELATTSGIQWDGVRYTASFVTGGTFSLDGVHLTGRGYALIANEFIKAINATYKSTLPQVNVNKYSGVTFP